MLRYLAAMPAFILMAAIAAAQTTTVPDTTVDFTPILQSLVTAAGAVILALGTWAGWYLKNLAASKADLSKTELDEKAQAIYNAALRRSIDAGMAKANEFIKNGAKIDVKSVIIKEGLEYFMEFWPDIASTMTPEKIAKTIEARLPPTTEAELKTAVAASKVVAQEAAVADAGKSVA